MSDESAQLELAVTQDAPPQGTTEREQDTARPSEAQTVENTESAEQQDTSSTDTEGNETNGAETDEQKNARVQQENEARQKRRSQGVQKRIDELTRDKHAERQAREHLEKINADLLARLTGGAQKPNGATADDGRPNPASYVHGESDAQYVRDDAAWLAEQRARTFIEQHTKAQTEAQQRQAQEQSQRAVRSAYLQRQREIAKTIPDYDRTMAEGAQDIEVPTTVFSMIERLPNGPLLAYHMVKNPALTEQFWSTPPEDHGYLLGQISATLKATAKVSNAPPPGRPAQAKTGSQANPPEDTDAYFAWAEKNMR